MQRHVAMPNPNTRHSAPADEHGHEHGQFRPHEDDQRFMQDDERYRNRNAGQGQGGYTSGRDASDRSLGFQSRNQGYPGDYDDHSRSDERFSGRGGSAYWQPDRGYNPDAWRRRHNPGNYGYGTDNYGTQGGNMFDANQGGGAQGHYGSPAGYGHGGGSYGPEGSGQNRGTPGWGNSERWESHASPQGGPARGGHRGKGPKNFTRTDERIREAVSEALEIHDDLDASDIEVSVKAGEVTLSGSVEDRHAKRLAEDITASVSGVRDVQNLIKISERPSHGYAMSDADPRKARA